LSADHIRYCLKRAAALTDGQQLSLDSVSRAANWRSRPIARRWLRPLHRYLMMKTKMPPPAAAAVALALVSPPKFTADVDNPALRGLYTEPPMNNCTSVAVAEIGWRHVFDKQPVDCDA